MFTERDFFGWPIRLRIFFTTLLAITRLLGVEFTTLPYPTRNWKTTTLQGLPGGANKVWSNLEMRRWLPRLIVARPSSFSLLGSGLEKQQQLWSRSRNNVLQMFWKSDLKERDILNSDGIQKKKKAKKDKYNRYDILMVLISKHFLQALSSAQCHYGWRM